MAGGAVVIGGVAGGSARSSRGARLNSPWSPADFRCAPSGSRTATCGFGGPGGDDGEPEGFHTYRFSISGDLPPFYPGISHSLNVRFDNPNPVAITIPPEALSIVVTGTRISCPAWLNFTVSRGLTASVTIPKHSTKSLSDLFVPQASWPVITMRDTAVDQSPCEGATFTLHYAAAGST